MNLVEETALVILGAVKGLAKTASSPDKWRRYCQSVGLPPQDLSWPANLDFQFSELENMILEQPGQLGVVLPNGWLTDTNDELAR